MADYKGVDKIFLQRLTNLRGIIELTQREAVSSMLKVENWTVVNTILSEMTSKAKSDTLYLKNASTKTA